jgi:hypothetical protein
MIVGSNPSPTKTVSTFEDALSFFKKMAMDYPGRELLYRGHADTAWNVVPSIFRQTPDISEYESDIIRELVSYFPHEFSSDRSMFDRLVRMQHYGLPTRLLDVSTNPLVALYFAVDPDGDDSKNGAVIISVGSKDRHKFYDSDTVSCMANLANLSGEERLVLAKTTASTIGKFNELKPAERLIQFIKDEKPYFLPRIRKVDLFRPISVTPKRSNARLSAQSGKFLIYGLADKNGPKYDKNNTMIKLGILAASKAVIRDRLEQLSMDGSTLFPEIDKAAKRIGQRYKRLAL